MYSLMGSNTEWAAALFLFPLPKIVRNKCHQLLLFVFWKLGVTVFMQQPWLILELRSTCVWPAPLLGSKSCSTIRQLLWSALIINFQEEIITCTKFQIFINCYLKQNTMAVTLLDIGGMIYYPGFTLKYSKEKGGMKAHCISLICVSCLSISKWESKI